jgi:hypothetical protein
LERKFLKARQGRKNKKDVMASDRLPSCTSGEGDEAGAGLAMAMIVFFRAQPDVIKWK